MDNGVALLCNNYSGERFPFLNECGRPIWTWEFGEGVYK